MADNSSHANGAAHSGSPFLIYGTGVIGSLYAVLFSKAGYPVSVYAKGRRLDYSDGLERLWREREILLKVSKEIKRNFSWMAERESLSPPKFHLVLIPAMAAVLRFLLKGDSGKTFVFPHCRKAPGELRLLHGSFYDYGDSAKKRGWKPAP